MVKVEKGTLLTCDPAIKEYLLYLREELRLPRDFIVHDLSETQLIVNPTCVETIQKLIDELMSQNTFPVGQTNNLSGQGKA